MKLRVKMDIHDGNVIWVVEQYKGSFFGLFGSWGMLAGFSHQLEALSFMRSLTNGMPYRDYVAVEAMRALIALGGMPPHQIAARAHEVAKKMEQERAKG